MRRNGFFSFGLSERESSELPTPKNASTIAAQEKFIREQLRRRRGDGMQRPTAMQVIGMIQNFRQQLLIDRKTIDSIIDEIWGIKRNPRGNKFNSGDFVKITDDTGTYYGIVDSKWPSSNDYLVYIALKDGNSAMATFAASEIKKAPVRQKEFSQITKHWGNLSTGLKKNPEPSITGLPKIHAHQAEQDKARLTAAFIGHRLGSFLPTTNTSMVAGCELCGNTVTITGKTIHGLAVTAKCYVGAK